MAKDGLIIIDGDTGEEIEDVIIRLDDEYYDKESTRLRASATFVNGRCRAEDFEIYEVGRTKDDYGKYLSYMRSPEWKQKRDLVLERDDFTCQSAGEKQSLQVHHITYENLFNEPLEDLITLCNRCHCIVHKKTGTFLLDNFIPDHPEYGEMMRIGQGCKFTKHFKDPCFSQGSYYQYWHKICKGLQQDTNVIKNRKPTLHKVRYIKELQKMCECSHPSIVNFMKECFKNKLIAEYKHESEKQFVVNPEYALNGNKMPTLLYNLFD
ncbi:hypothetical protein LCGC14_3013320 [marine sediment metagenome]|uniref:HNH nuclease domain-containing protein n=1 Tax=marine sediment metagenome TaxID=412755 RepID=A0A0F8XKE0_9ZZZZ